MIDMAFSHLYRNWLKLAMVQRTQHSLFITFNHYKIIFVVEFGFSWGVDANFMKGMM
ncbi:MAG: hypothetical protein RIR48_3006 [Bacteroidota bacterium]|jgi:hypothetical protein